LEESGVKWVFDDWQLSGLTTFTSGSPVGIGYSFVAAVDLTGASGAGVDSRINVISNPVIPKSERTELRHFNTERLCPADPRRVRHRQRAEGRPPRPRHQRL
jgi:hypothetical protein